jgi:energy-coupling factor transport system permease protein
MAAGLWVVRVPARYALRSVWKALPFLALLAVLQVLVMPANRTGAVLGQWWVITITTGGLLAGALLIARFVALILAISLLSFTTGTNELMHGVEHLLRPLQRLGLPAHELAMTLDIALRSVPLLAQEAERLAKAQASRGGESGGARGGPIRRAEQALPLLVPLFLGALQRAERLALAMEARGYVGGKGRSHLVALRMRPADWISLVITIGLAILVALI